VVIHCLLLLLLLLILLTVIFASDSIASDEESGSAILFPTAADIRATSTAGERQSLLRCSAHQRQQQQEGLNQTAAATTSSGIIMHGYWWNSNGEGWWSVQMREQRHNPCLMRPLTLVLLLAVLALGLLLALLRIPTFLLGMLLAPLTNRFAAVVEFWYPTSIGRFLHLRIAKMAAGRNPNPNPNHGKPGDDANHGCHSRCLETRIEVVPGRVFVHPLPQLLDNLGECLDALVVAVPCIFVGVRAAVFAGFKEHGWRCGARDRLLTLHRILIFTPRLRLE
jgi:hypothetical protein